MPTRLPIQILDVSTDQLVTADLVTGLTALDLYETETNWGPERRRMIRRLHETGTPVDQLPKYYGWDWGKKAPKLKLLDAECIGIECQNIMQGLMLIRTAIYSARLEPDVDRPLVYIDYLEVAPWNTSQLTRHVRYKLVGTKLFEAAVAFSRNLEFHGRVGLHSLPLSESFYLRCHMTDCGIDAEYENLNYFELTRSAADLYWKGT